MCRTDMEFVSTRRSGTDSRRAPVVALLTMAMLAWVPAPLAAQRSSSAGWVGLSVVQTGHGDNTAGMSMDYPVVVSVEPGSPAQLAGLLAGDTVLAYNDVDAHSDPLAARRFLKPGERLVVKIRRNGIRSLALTVAQRSMRSAYRMNITVASDGTQPLGALPVAAPFSPRHEGAFAGAQIARLNAGLARVLNVRDMGVLVLEVLPGTPAMRSGLQSGDVILRADTSTVTTPLDLLRALRDAPDHTVALELLRKGRSQTVTMHW